MLKVCWMQAQLFTALTIFAVCLGCSSDANPPTFPVSGVVKLAGKPVEGATIVFTPISKDAEGATGKSDSAGAYSMTTYVNSDGVRPGEYMIKVFKFESLAPPPSESSPDFDPNAELEDEGYDPDKVDTRAAKNLLPKKYASEVTSGLKIEVKEAGMTFDINLK